MTYLLSLFLTVLFSSGAFAHLEKFHSRADALATANGTSKAQHPWPFPLLSIGHAMHSYQNYGFTPYWHDGLDIRSEIDQPIYAAAGGKVVNIENYIQGDPLYWEVAIMDAEGFVWKYHHVDRKSIPKEIEEAYRTKTSVAAGTLLGNVVRWPIETYGEVYHHLHLLVVASDKRYTNPFLLLEPLPDTKSPVITKIGIARNHRPTDLTSVKGAHSLYVEASDLVLHDKFILPPHKISYAIDGASPKLLWNFTHLPAPTDDEKFITDFYLDGTCGSYGCRRFYFNLNFTPESPRAQLRLKPGPHTVKVMVEDFVGNKAEKDFTWTVIE